MSEKEVGLHKLLHHESFPLSSKYDPEWVIDNEMGPNVLWLTEALCEVMDLKPGMRVLDLGCGGAMSSTFLAKEFGVQVWATGLWINATDNWKRIREAGVEHSVFPVHADARALPYADEFLTPSSRSTATTSSAPMSTTSSTTWSSCSSGAASSA